MSLTPEPASTLKQLLAFYLEAGVDCALAEEPVDRLAEPDVVPAAVVVRETAPPARSGKCRRRSRQFRAAK